ncbi:hypothetical protein [Coralloluteibacterium stylophorae]|uniref:Uncharacterized protein n=1 Tax=Coralloluteibacterium stylophorae TaxID=1776034 RepID=A0A8J7VVS3_9GAMM|nr:hypothetical protein [Coralloluteibacterium stylophorae]MBS7458022.1 hypothetical protein [Coralloluteibacterium stylophorae]
MTPRPPPMDPSRLERLLDAYGGDPARWPERERAAALALLAADPVARARTEAAAGFDALIALPQADASPRLRQRVLATIPAPRPTLGERLRTLFEPFGGWRMAGPAFAASLALGVAFGALMPKDDSLAPGEALVQYAQLDDRYAEFSP